MNMKIVLMSLLSLSSFAQSDIFPIPGGDILQTPYKDPTTTDFVKREVMIPMRDGVKLFTVLLIPKGVERAPMVLTRTPYEASKRVKVADTPFLVSSLRAGDDIFAQGDYIRIFQDVRGKYKSEGDYVAQRPVIGRLNPTNVDHVTDAWDTIEWLTKNVPESNGKVGMIGNSYEGLTVAMALLDPHPALKVAVPQGTMVDGWMGDDWFHNGAFRQNAFDYFVTQTSEKDEGGKIRRFTSDDYEEFLRAGSAGDFAKLHAVDQFPFIKRIFEHPSYSAFWQDQALDKMFAKKGNRVPTIWLTGLFDQEDIYGTIAVYNALKGSGHLANNHLVLGPWSHGQVNRDGFSLGALKWSGDTAKQFRLQYLKPFLDQYLKDKAPKAQLPRALIYNTGDNLWESFSEWPRACEKKCDSPMKPLYLQNNFGLGFQKPSSSDGVDEYISDPAKPVPYQRRPTRFADTDAWRPWLVSDQRAVADRTDVLVYETEVLTSPITIAGSPIVELFASTSGTDSDWVVKLIDVYPDQYVWQPELAGYQFAVALDIFRGRYRESFSQPSAIPANQVQRYRFNLPPTNHVFQPGHRVMVQIQSSLFPLYDRNPQTYVENIFWAKPKDYAKATQKVYRTEANASAIWLPVVAR